jgi:hypothetical protein
MLGGCGNCMIAGWLNARCVEGVSKNPHSIGAASCVDQDSNSLSMPHSNSTEQPSLPHIETGDNHPQTGDTYLQTGDTQTAAEAHLPAAAGVHWHWKCEGSHRLTVRLPPGCWPPQAAAAAAAVLSLGLLGLSGAPRHLNTKMYTGV